MGKTHMAKAHERRKDEQKYGWIWEFNVTS